MVGAGEWSTRMSPATGHCMQPVEWVGRWKFLKGFTKVWSCERHADELIGLGVLGHSGRQVRVTFRHTRPQRRIRVRG